MRYHASALCYIINTLLLIYYINRSWEDIRQLALSKMSFNMKHHHTMAQTCLSVGRTFSTANKAGRYSQRHQYSPAHKIMSNVKTKAVKKRHITNERKTTTTAISRPPHRSTGVTWHLQWIIGWFCYSKVLLPACPYWRQVAHTDEAQDTRVFSP